MLILEPREHFFTTLIGLELQKQLLQRMWHSNRLPQTLLFSGTSSIGKRSLAFALSKFVNCETGNAETGQCTCRSCTLLSRGVHPDIFVVEPRGASKTIQVDQMREVQDISNSAPIEGRRKIIIIVDADRMNLSAANSALKILEEPPSYLLLILLATSRHQLLPTVRSRCTSIDLTPASVQEIESWLRKGLDVSETSAQLAAAFSTGVPGIALELTRRNYLGKRDLLLRELDFMLNNGFPALFAVADELSKRFSHSEMVELLLSWFRDVLVAQFTAESTELFINKDAADDILRLAEYHSPEALHRVYKELLDAHALTNRIINKRLLAIVVLLRLGKLLKTR